MNGKMKIRSITPQQEIETLRAENRQLREKIRQQNAQIEALKAENQANGRSLSVSRANKIGVKPQIDGTPAANEAWKKLLPVDQLLAADAPYCECNKCKAKKSVYA